MHDISIIIPAFNEEAVIAKTIARIVEFFKKLGMSFELIVVDDGSTDRTREIVREKMGQYPMLRLSENKQNRGKGFSVKQGALSSDGEWILFLDADLSTAPEEFEKFRKIMKNYDIVIGSRAILGAEIKVHQPILRELAGKIFNKIIKVYLGLPFYDTQCGFKCFNKKTKILFQKQKLEGWVFDVELLYLARNFGFRVAEVPITWANDPTSTVKSGDFFKVIRDIRTVKRFWGNNPQN